MKITWVTRSFLDYRIPVFKALDEMCGHQLTVVYYKDIPPKRTQDKLKAVLGDRAIARERELRIGNRPKVDNASKANSSIRIPLSPGLIKQVMQTKPDVLVSDGFMQWTYAALVTRFLKGVPHVMCYERTKHTERNAGKLRTAYRKFVSHWIDAIDCNGVQTEEYLAEIGYPKNRLTHGHMVADVVGLSKAVAETSDHVVSTLRAMLGCKNTMILFVGQLIPRKGVKELIEAWCSFKEREESDVTLVCVGNGVQMGEIKQLITVKNIPDVMLAGAVDYDLIAPYYKAADCFIIPTLEDNWSLVVPEAMACNLPIATSKYNGCHPELVHPENGWVFDPLDKDSIVRTLQEIVKHSADLKQMGEVSREIVSHYTPERAAQSIMDACYIAINHRKKYGK